MIAFILGALTMLAGIIAGSWLTQRTQQGKSILPDMPKALHKVVPAKRDEFIDDE